MALAERDQYASSWSPLREVQPSKILYGHDLEIAGSAIEIYTVLGDLEAGIMRRGVFEARIA